MSCGFSSQRPSDANIKKMSFGFSFRYTIKGSTVIKSLESYTQNSLPKKHKSKHNSVLEKSLKNVGSG
jgi:hypothetical protein